MPFDNTIQTGDPILEVIMHSGKRHLARGPREFVRRYFNETAPLLNPQGKPDGKTDRVAKVSTRRAPVEADAKVEEVVPAVDLYEAFEEEGAWGLRKVFAYPAPGRDKFRVILDATLSRKAALQIESMYQQAHPPREWEAIWTALLKAGFQPVDLTPAPFKGTRAALGRALERNREACQQARNLHRQADEACGQRKRTLRLQARAADAVARQSNEEHARLRRAVREAREESAVPA